MSIRLRVLIILLVAVLLVPVNVLSQEPSASPKPASVEQTPNGQTASADATKAAESSAPPTEPDFWHRETMTGDWGGTRSRWKEKGVELEFKLTQFYQGVARGGLRNSSEYNGKFEYTLKFDLGKLAHWK